MPSPTCSLNGEESRDLTSREPLPEDPPKTPKEELEDLRQTYTLRGHEYFPTDDRDRCLKIFSLFSQKNKGFASLEELKVGCWTQNQEIMVCCNCKYENQVLLEQFYDMMATPQGIKHADIFILLSKKKKDKDRKAELMKAFAFLPLNEEGKMDTDTFFEFLVHKGFKYSEEQAQAVIKEADPKGTGWIDVSNFADLLLNTEAKKKKTSKKAKT